MFQYMTPRTTDDSIGIDLQKACRLCIGHTCQDGLNYFQPIIIRELQSLALNWKADHPYIQMDEAVIYYRCGDVFLHKHHTEYGILRYSSYLKRIPSNVKSIGIVTGKDTKMSGTCRNEGCPFDGLCSKLSFDIQDYISRAYPKARVTIRNNESVATSISRMVLSKMVVCNPSTFSLYPCIATFGTSYIVHSRLYPWVQHLNNAHVKVIHDRFISSGWYATNLAKSKSAHDDLSSLLRANT